jgi:hypothetical protein
MSARSCWTCRDQKIGGFDTFLGLCRYFETKGQPAKPIPSHVVDVGCKCYVNALTRYWNSHEVERPQETAA